MISWRSGDSRQRDHKWFNKEYRDSKSSLNKSLRLVRRETLGEYNKVRSEHRKLIDRKKRKVKEEELEEVKKDKTGKKF